VSQTSRPSTNLIKKGWCEGDQDEVKRLFLENIFDILPIMAGTNINDY